MELNLTPQELAQQLKKPSGDSGLKVAEFMNKGNSNFYEKLQEEVEWFNGMRILEIGFGNGQHISQFFKKAKDIQYVGVDYSEKMIELASENYPNCQFYLADVIDLDLKDEPPFDLIISINTVYFINDLGKLAIVLKNHLSKSGFIYLGKRPKEDMDLLSTITQHEFITYDNETVVKALMENNLDIDRVLSFKDEPFNRAGQQVQLHSDFIIAKYGN